MPDSWDARQRWDARYRERSQLWSGQANAALVDVAGGLPSGRALDIGAGEGADALWLARRGWTVTAVDISPVAMDRARRAATAAGIGKAGVTWLARDVRSWTPPDQAFDLMTAFFMHSFGDTDRWEVFGRLAQAVAIGGRLAVVSHEHSPASGDPLTTLEDELDGLARTAQSWQVVTGEVRDRQVVGPDGATRLLRDVVLVARRTA